MNDSKKYKWRLLYKPPVEEEKDDDPDTWRKVFYLDKYQYPTGLNLSVKLTEMKHLYNMKKEYMILEDMENNYE